MTIWTFLKDRLFFIVIYFSSLAVTLLVIQLDLLQSHLYIHKENIGYILVLSVFLILMYLIISFLRQSHYYRQINRIMKTKGLERTTGLDGAVTAEQKHYQDLFHDLYRDYAIELNHFEEQKERYSDFINQWVHNMKTPVSVIHLLVQNGSQAAEDETVDERFRSIEEEVERLSEGLEMVLYAARLDQLETDAAFKRVDIVACIRQVINENKKLMIRHAIFPKLVSNKESVYVETDLKWLLFLLKQLTSNAMKYSPKGKNLSLTYEVIEDERGVTLCLQDQGIGIPKEDLPRVFDPFFTGENGRIGADSTGMGLYFSKAVCDRLGHALWLTSREGDGTQAHISFLGEGIHRELVNEKMTVL